MIFLVNKDAEKYRLLIKHLPYALAYDRVLTDEDGEAIDYVWINIFGRVALSGKSTSFEGFSEPLQRWYAVNAYSDEPGFFATVFEKLTARRKIESALSESEGKFKRIAGFRLSDPGCPS